jgi:hypothetical protein
MLKRNRLIRTTRSRFTISLSILICLTALVGFFPNKQVRALSGDDLQAEGAFTCNFGIPIEAVGDPTFPGILERDRMYMAARSGLMHKHIPLSFDISSAQLRAGGRYLFDTAVHAERYKQWVENDFILDGIKFFDRPEIRNPDCHAWSVIGAHDFGDIHTSQVVVRTERWRVPEENQRVRRKNRWPAIRAQAAEAGLTGVWLLYNKSEQLVALVYFADRVVPKDPLVLDFVSLAALESSLPLGRVFDDLGWDRTSDLTQWVLTIWFPFVLGDQGEPSVWPHSPPLPEPFCGDTVCEVSRGENHQNCPTDCQPQCGDGKCQTGENTTNCPGDCRLK